MVLVNADDGEIRDRWKIPTARFYDSDRRLVRLLRSGIHALLPLQNDRVILVTRKLIYRLSLRDGSVDGLFSGFQGSRPLFICQSNAGDIYFGDYFGNPDRAAVNIYRSKDQGESYQIVHTFPPGAVRHIHGIFHDRFTDQVWVTTGDHDQESVIWKTKDDFRNLEYVQGGTQTFRAVQLIFTEDHVYFGSDTPLGENHLYRLKRSSNEVETLQQVQGSVFYGCQVGNHLFFSTVVEPSEVNQDPFAYIWGSRDGISWEMIKKYQKDWLPKKLFQYGQIHFPRGENRTNTLWWTPFATKMDLTLQQMPVTEIWGEA